MRAINGRVCLSAPATICNSLPSPLARLTVRFVAGFHQVGGNYSAISTPRGYQLGDSLRIMNGLMVPFIVKLFNYSSDASVFRTRRCASEQSHTVTATASSTHPSAHLSQRGPRRAAGESCRALEQAHCSRNRRLAGHATPGGRLARESSRSETDSI